jgi:hypothetical protein
MEVNCVFPSDDIGNGRPRLLGRRCLLGLRLRVVFRHFDGLYGRCVSVRLFLTSTSQKSGEMKMRRGLTGRVTSWRGFEDVRRCERARCYWDSVVGEVWRSFWKLWAMPEEEVNAKISCVGPSSAAENGGDEGFTTFASALVGFTRLLFDCGLSIHRTSPSPR